MGEVTNPFQNLDQAPFEESEIRKKKIQAVIFSNSVIEAMAMIV